MHNIIVTLGILIALMPFLGFSGVVENVFFTVVGLVIAIVAYYDGFPKQRHEVCNNETTYSAKNNEVKTHHNNI